MFYFKQTEDEFGTGLPMPFETGRIFTKEQTPEGSVIVETQEGLDTLVEKAERENLKLVGAFDPDEDLGLEPIPAIDDLKTLTQAEYARKYKVAGTRKLAEDMGVGTRDDGGKLLSEKNLVARIYEAVST